MRIVPKKARHDHENALFTAICWIADSRAAMLLT
jgi:hypothetical protein